MIRLAQIAAGQMLCFYDQHTVIHQGIVGKRNRPAAKHVADNMLEFRSALRRGIDDSSGNLGSHSAGFAGRNCQESSNDNNCVEILQFLPAQDPVLLPDRLRRNTVYS